MRSNFGDATAIIKSALFQAAAGNNQSVVAAVTGQIIRIVGWIMQANTAQGTILFKSASAGTQLTGLITFPPSTALPFLLPIDYAGYFQTNSGEGLFADVATNNVNLTVFYVTYVS